MDARQNEANPAAGKPRWSAEPKNNNRDWRLRYAPAPGGVKNPDGSTTITCSFPVLEITDWVDEPETVANDIARTLNAYDDLATLAKRMRDVMRTFSSEAGDEAATFADKIDAALAPFEKGGA